MDAPRSRPLKFAIQTGLDRITEKVASYAGDASQIKDLVRSRIVFNSLDEVYSAVKTVANEIDIVGYKDRFLKPVESGFRDILINLKLPNGHIGEIRLSTEIIETIAAIEHPIYEQVRTIRDAAKAASRELTFAEATQIDEMLALFRPMYDNAYLDLLKTTWSGLSGSSP